MADPVRGIYGATPIEMMHAFCKDMIEMVTFLILDNVPKSKFAALDALAKRFHKSHRQTIRRMFSATDFSKGITILSKRSAAERLGFVFCLSFLPNMMKVGKSYTPHLRPTMPKLHVMMSLLPQKSCRLISGCCICI
jgi:hypothetical protein